jgi:hypothetical protein
VEKSQKEMIFLSEISVPSAPPCAATYEAWALGTGINLDDMVKAVVQFFFKASKTNLIGAHDSRK